MSIGSGIAVAGWFVAFVWACTISDGVALGVVASGVIVAAAHFFASD